MKPLGRWGMVFETHESDRPPCSAGREDPLRCSCGNGCSECFGTGFKPYGATALGYIGSRAICKVHWKGQIEAVALLRELFGLGEAEGLNLTPGPR